MSAAELDADRQHRCECRRGEVRTEKESATEIFLRGFDELDLDPLDNLCPRRSTRTRDGYAQSRRTQQSCVD